MTPSTKRARTAALAAILFALLAGSRAGEPLAFSADSVRVDRWSLMGPMALGNDTMTSGALGTILEAIGEDGPRAETVAWYGRDPYRWLECAVGASGHAAIDHAFTSARDGQVVFLARRILCAEPREAVLSIDAAGRTAAWVNGALALDSGGEPWASPGPDRWLRPVRMRSGVNLLIVKTWRPEGDAWRIGARLLTRAAFEGNAVAFPRWEFDIAPPWDIGNPPRVRWGDPGVLGLLARSPTSVTVHLAIGETRRQAVATRGRWIPLASLIPAKAERRPGLYQIGADASGPGASHAIALGPLDRAASQAAGIAGLRKADLPPDVGEALRFLAQAAPRHHDGRGAVFHTAIRSVAFFREWATDPENARWPEGWLRALAPPPDADSPAVPYMLFLPSEARLWSAPPPLLVVVPREGADATSILRRHPGLAGAARHHAVVLAVAAPPRRLEKWPKAASAEDFVAAIAADVARRAGVDPQRIAALGLGSGGRIVARCDLRHSHLFAALAFEGPCDRGALLSELLSGGAARTQNILVLDADGIARISAGGEREALSGDGTEFARLLSFLKKHPLDPWPSAADATGIAPPGVRSRWLRLRAAEDQTRRAHAFARFDRRQPNHIALSVGNVARLDLLLDDAPEIDTNNPLVLDITRTSPSASHQRLQVIGPGFPEAVALRLRERGDAAPHWELAALARTTFEEAGADPVRYQLSKAVAARPDADNGGIATLAARAIREASGARVALLPADAFHRGHAAGGVRGGDIAAWCDDMRIVVRKMEPKVLIEIVASDYAGPRIFVTDGLKARAAPSDANPGDYLDCALNTTEGPVSVAIAASLRHAAPELLDGDAPSGTPMFAHETLLRHFERDPMIEPIASDIGLLPVKHARPLKKVVRRAP